jgi:integrase
MVCLKGLEIVVVGNIGNADDQDPHAAAARLLYGSGMRLAECCQLRVKDVQRGRGPLVVRTGKGNKDRVVMLPRAVRDDLERQLAWRRRLHERDLLRGVARVELPDALKRKYPRAAQDLGWQFVFGSRQLSHCPRTGLNELAPEAIEAAAAASRQLHGEQRIRPDEQRAVLSHPVNPVQSV